MTGDRRAVTPTPDRPHAPGPLSLVQGFVNSVDLEAGIETLPTPAALGAWLTGRGLLLDRNPVAADLARALELREALREALEENAHPIAHPGVREDLAGPPLAPGESDTEPRLTAAAAAIPLHVVTSPSGPRLQPAGSGVDAALGTILATAVAAAADGSWSRLKVCRNDACRWAYWDGSRNRSGTWCSMAICGNRAKARTFRRRRVPSATVVPGRTP